MMYRHLIQLTMSWLITMLVLESSIRSKVTADDVADATQIVMRIDDIDVEDGELRLILQDSGLAEQASPVARQASAAILVRQHLALKSLLSLGGKSIQAIIDRELTLTSKQLASSGSSLAKVASDRGVSLHAYRRHLTWQIAWREYLKSRVTDAALKSHFESQKEQYGGRQYLASQIFVSSKPTKEPDTDASKSELEKLAETISQSPDVAGSFALAAKQHSEAASANQGGDIGWVGLDGDLPSTVMNAVRMAGIGEVVGPVSSPIGYHLVLIREHREVEVKWDSVTDQNQIRRDYANDLFLGLVRQQNSAKVQNIDEALHLKPR